MSMAEFKIVIVGMTPLLTHRFTDEAALAATGGTRAATNGEKKTPMQQAEDGLYLGTFEDRNDVPVMPGPNLLRCLIDAGKFHKSGKVKVTTMKSSLIAAACMMAEPYYEIVSEGGWTVDTRPVRIPATGGRILRSRPCWNDWKIEFDLTLDTEIISKSLMRLIVSDAGRKIGLGDFRPDTKGPFGRFTIERMEEVSDSSDAPTKRPAGRAKTGAKKDVAKDAA